MNSITNRSIHFAGIVLAAFVLALVPLMAPQAHAADVGGGYDFYDYGPSDSGSYDFYDYGSSDYSTPSYDYGTPSYDYGCSSCSTGGYNYGTPSYDYGCSSCSTGGYGYTYPGSYGCTSCGGYVQPTTYPVFTPPAYTPPSNIFDNGNTYNNIPTTVTDVGNTTNSGNTYTYAPVTTDTCTGNSCNTTISTPINAPTTVTITNPNNNSTPSYVPVYQQPIYSTPVQPYYPPVTYNQPRPFAYNNAPAPYVSLKAVPYTGLDLGPVGTAMYWGFIALWALFAAYLLAVKRVQNGLVAKLFGKKAATTAPIAAHAPLGRSPMGEAAPARKAAATTSTFGNIDPFIASQLQKLA